MIRCLIQLTPSLIGGPPLLPLILQLSTPIPSQEFTSQILPAIVRMFASPDRAMRVALLENLDHFKDKLDAKTVQEKIWPNLVQGFGDTVAIVREMSVRSVLGFAPKVRSSFTLKHPLLVKIHMNI
jgi:SCY1-like protein 1